MAYDPSGRGTTGFPPGAVLNPDGTITYGGQTYPNGSFMSADGSVQTPASTWNQAPGSATPNSPVPGENVAVGQVGAGTNTGTVGGKNYNLPGGGYTMANGRGTFDQYNADGTLRRAGAAGPQGSDAFNSPGIGTEGYVSVEDWVDFSLAPVTGGTSLIPGSPTGIPGSAAQGGADALTNDEPVLEGIAKGVWEDPSVKSFRRTLLKGAQGLADLGVDLFGGGSGGGAGGAGGKADPYVVKQPPPIDPTQFTAPLNALGQSATSSGTNWAGRQGDLAKNLLAAPSVAAAAGNAMAERTAQENAAQLASARGANTALLLRQAAGSADARTRGITSDLATAQAQEAVDRAKTAGSLLGQAAGSENAGYATGINAAQAAGQIGAGLAQNNAGNQIAAEGINAGSHDATNATNAGIGRDANASRDKWIDRTLTAAGSVIPLIFSSDIRNKENVQPLGASPFGELLALATAGRDSETSETGRPLPTAGAPSGRPGEMRHLLELASAEGNRENLGELQPYAYTYKPGLAAATGDDTAPRPGVMTRDLLRTAAGRDAVVETPNGEGIDANRGLSFALAANAGLDKRMQELEEAVAANDERKRRGSRTSPFTESLRTLGQTSPARAPGGRNGPSERTPLDPSRDARRDTMPRTISEALRVLGQYSPAEAAGF